jgi:hypothetical protein
LHDKGVKPMMMLTKLFNKQCFEAHTEHWTWEQCSTVCSMQGHLTIHVLRVSSTDALPYLGDFCGNPNGNLARPPTTENVRWVVTVLLICTYRFLSGSLTCKV